MTPLTPQRLFAMVGGSACVLGLVVLVAPEFGSTDASFLSVLSGAAEPEEILVVLRLRLPRAILAALAGGALAMCGASMQGILSNPLADPYTLGLASGAALAAVVAIKLGAGAGWLFGLVPVSAFIGALLASAAVWGLARIGRRGHMTPEGMLLAGVTLAFIASAGVLFIQYLSEPFEIARMVRWMMGGVEVVGFGVIGGTLPLLLPGMVILLMQAGRLNQIALGEQIAASRGVDVNRVRMYVLIGTALATGAVVAAAGPIGFVGLIVPHAVRFIVGADHRALLPCSFMIGAAFLVVCDTVARTIIAPMDIPLGVLTALLGGPFFLWILATRRR